MLDRKRAQVMKIFMELKESYEELDDTRNLALNELEDNHLKIAKIGNARKKQESELHELERTKADLVIENCDLDNEMIALRRENQHIEY